MNFTLDVNVRFPDQSSDLAELKTLMVQLSADLHSFKDQIMATAQQLVAQVTAIGAEVGNISTAVDALIAAQAAAGSTTPEEDAAMAALQTSVDALQAKVATPPAP